MKVALPDSGSNAGTALAHLTAEMLGFTTRDRIRLIWGDSDIAPSSDEWFGGRTITLQGAAICSAADKLRKDLLARAAAALHVSTDALQIRDGVISSTDDPSKKITLRRVGQSQPWADPHRPAAALRAVNAEDRTKASARVSPKWRWIPGPAIGASFAPLTCTTRAS